MADISMCERKDCKKSKTCLRFASKPSERQSYILIENVVNCEYYLEVKK